jgi:hypothetical protein
VEFENTAGSRTKFGARDAGAASRPLIEQLFSQPMCLRSGQAPDALQQHELRAVAEISAIAGSVRAAIRNAASNLGKA